jgi:hypothetical protein
LQNTLYRPRDVLTLLNSSSQIAARCSRQTIIDDDVTAAAKMISNERLSDLLKEYDRVFPGLRLFVNVFKGTKALWTYSEVMSLLSRAFEEQSYAVEEASDFALLGSASDIFLALYSVGFLGVQRESGGPYVFCHDGASADLHQLPATMSIAIHPCYWRALDAMQDSPSIQVLAHVFDEYEPPKDDEIKDLRMQRLGQVIEELPHLSEGSEDAAAFEEWTLRAVRILFPGHLANVELHSCPDGVQRRDLVATVVAEKGFWRRVLDDYKSRQIVFEVKNFAELGPNDYRQALSYTGKEYGKIVFIIYRTRNDTADEKERKWLQEMYNRHDVLVFLLPAKFLSRFISKRRSGPRNDYWDKTLSKMLDTHLRTYLSLKATQRRK